MRSGWDGVDWELEAVVAVVARGGSRGGQGQGRGRVGRRSDGMMKCPGL